jgi:hypothetical protein
MFSKLHPVGSREFTLMIVYSSYKKKIGVASGREATGQMCTQRDLEKKLVHGVKARNVA